MAKPRSWELKHGFYAYFYSKDFARPRSVREIERGLKRDYSLAVDYSTVSRMISAMATMLEKDAAIRDSYEKFKGEQKSATYFFKQTDEGIESPYEVVRSYARDYLLSHNNIVTRYLRNTLKWGEKFWVYTGRKAPEHWTNAQATEWLQTLTAGSRYNGMCGVTAFHPTLKLRAGRTKGLKGEARMPDVLKLPNFPLIWERVVKAALELAPLERRGDMEFILRVKPMTGIRTGAKVDGRELWGTKIGPAYNNRFGKKGSYIHVIEGNLIWHVFAKKTESWDITFLEDGLRSYIINFVQLKQSRGKEWLITEFSTNYANKILAQACAQLGIEKLELHDCRKIWVSYLVRIGMPLERAININVGWKDIKTAAKHYLALRALSREEEQKYLGALAKLAAGQWQAVAA